MDDQIKHFRLRAKELAEKLRALAPKEVLLIHHNDTDGLTSGTLLHKTLERLGCKIRRVCLEKPYPQALEVLLSDPGACIFFTDFASGMLSEIERISGGHQNIFVLDHHSVDEKPHPHVHVLNPLMFGIPGSDDCSASAVCFEFALACSEFNSDLAHLGVLGALGDRQFSPTGRLKGINALVFEQARSLGLASFADEYLIRSGFVYKGVELVSHVDALGSFGYFEGGTDVAIKGLSEGFDERYVNQATSLRSRYQENLNKFLSASPLNVGEKLIWFHTQDAFLGMGVKTVGLVCEEVIASYKDKPMYVLGFQTVPNEIPGLGAINLGQVKLSMRISEALHAQVRKAQAMPISQLLKQMIAKLGGFIDACHAHSGAATVKQGMEGQVVKTLAGIIEQSCI